MRVSSGRGKSLKRGGLREILFAFLAVALASAMSFPQPLVVRSKAVQSNLITLLESLQAAAMSLEP